MLLTDARTGVSPFILFPSKRLNLKLCSIHLLLETAYDTILLLTHLQVLGSKLDVSIFHITVRRKLTKYLITHC